MTHMYIYIYTLHVYIFYTYYIIYIIYNILCVLLYIICYCQALNVPVASQVAERLKT